RKPARTKSTKRSTTAGSRKSVPRKSSSPRKGSKQALDRGREALIELYGRHRPALNAIAWEWEETRWTELLRYVLYYATPLTATEATQAIEALTVLGVVDPRRDISEDDIALLLVTFTRVGATEDEAEQATAVVVQLMQSIREELGGFVQRLL